MRKLLGRFPVKTVLAVDGGASKVDCALVDVNGNVLGAVRRRGRYNFGLGSNGSLDGLASAVKAAQASAVAALGVFCLAGADLALADRRIAAELEMQRWTRTMLEELVPRFFGLSRPTAVMEALYVGSLDRARLNDAAPLVFQAAAAGDRVGQSLIDEMTAEIIVTATAAIRRLRLAGRDVHVVLGGGVLKAAGDDMLARITGAIRGAGARGVFFGREAPPGVGAAWLGVAAPRAPAQARRGSREPLTL